MQEQKEALLQQIKDRQDRVRAILESAPLQKGQHNLRYDSAGTSHQQDRVAGLDNQALEKRPELLCLIAQLWSGVSIFAVICN